MEQGIIDGGEARLAEEIRLAARRRSAREVELAGAARCLAAHSATIREALLFAVSAFAGRRAYSRALYRGGIRALAELGEPAASGLIAEALEGDDAGGESTLAAACLDSSAALSTPLAHVVMRRQTHRAFAAEVARLARGESDGAALTSIAPKINEAHRIELCMTLFVPLLFLKRRMPLGVAPALRVLRDSERHLGRWLVLAALATHAGDQEPMRFALERSQASATNVRAAWELIRWALLCVQGEVSQPRARPTLGLISRLSDRPSAERDTSFLFRMAAARVRSAKSLLEKLQRASSKAPEQSLRAQLYLLRDYARQESHRGLVSAARPTGKGPCSGLRGLAAAALFDAGDRDTALELCNGLSSSRHLAEVAWAVLVDAKGRANSSSSVVEEVTFRRIHKGWLE